MIVWLWDAAGPACARHGITDNQARAIELAETYLSSGQAIVAEVESAVLVSGLRTLTSGYERTGRGWRGRCGDSGVRWEPLPPEEGTSPEPATSTARAGSRAAH